MLIIIIPVVLSLLERREAEKAISLLEREIEDISLLSAQRWGSHEWEGLCQIKSILEDLLQDIQRGVQEGDVRADTSVLVIEALKKGGYLKP